MNKESESEVCFCLTTQSPEATLELGRKIGQAVQPATVIGLEGTLGSGKTKLTQGIVQSVVDAPETVVVSPTYTLCIPYSGRVELQHLDAYRIVEDEEVFDLGLDESVDDGGVLVVEWVGKIRDLLPQLDLLIGLEAATGESNSSERQITFQALTSHGREQFMELAKKGGESQV